MSGGSLDADAHCIADIVLKFLRKKVPFGERQKK
jgi:hypothetical protein